MTPLPASARLLLALLVILASLYDTRERRVPNWLTLAGLLLGLGINAALYQGEGLWSGLRGVGLAMLIYFPLWLLRGVGAGDVKLMAAVGSIVGPANWIVVLVLTSIMSAVSGLVLALAKGRLASTLGNVGRILGSLASGQRPFEQHPNLDVRNPQALRLPHAVSIALGSLMFLIATRFLH